MLGKLMKYEFKATSRMLLPINGAMLLFALINRLFMELNFFQTGNMAISALATVMAVMYVMVIIAAFVITLIVIIQRFYKNLLTDEGYLMFTLPVKAHSHITSKGIVAFVWYLASFVVCALSIFILVVDQNVIDGLSQFFTVELPRYFQLAGGDGIAILFEVLALFLLSFVSGILMSYCSIALGSLFHNHKILGAFGMYLAINFVMQIIGTVGILVGFASSNDAALWSTMDSIRLVSTVVLPLCIAYYAVFSVVFYWVTNFIFQKKLNLE